ncbi:MAG TPA: TlpA disulfide reductase family protein, partial [Bacteriovoracaceae bacterium]|nr:TlpA disulfide reductase family protein [Bacteriovoracaceae bacterium]
NCFIFPPSKVTKSHDWNMILANDLKGLKHMMTKNWMIFQLLLILVSFQANSKALNTGPWRFELKTTNAVVPFIINFKYFKNKLTGELINGKEKIKLSDMIIDDKTLSIPLQTYEVTLNMKRSTDVYMSGELVRHNKNPKVTIPVQASFGQKYRYPQDKYTAAINLQGKWSVTMKDEDGVVSPGILIFDQQKEKLSGTIMTPTGDYRYFEGFVSNKNFEAASFDGVFNYVLRGELKDKVLKAALLSNSITNIEGTLDPKASLPDPYKHTQVEALNFSFPDLKGNLISLNDKRFKNKPVVVQFFGSWCPNCMDEMNFLIPWYNQNQKRGVEIIALAFERSVDPTEAKKQLIKVSTKKKVPYPLLIGGSTSEDKPKDKISGLKNFISFPTTVFLNKRHEVVKVHAGFTGPSTGEYFIQWKNEFNQTINGLLK